MRNLAELNLNDGGEPVTRAPPSADIIRAFEAEFGRPLPADYLAFLEFSNGGYPEADTFVSRDPEGEEVYAVNHFLKLGADPDDGRTLWTVLREYRPLVGGDLLPFAETGTGDVLMLDFTTDPPCVVFCSHEDDYDLFEVAPSFEVFIDGLHIDPEDM